jgi:large subunit ribosomal protein L32
MALPKRKHSKARRDKRRGANSKLTPASLSVCTHCKKLATSHRVCPHCGYYKGKPVVIQETVKDDKKKK